MVEVKGVDKTIGGCPILRGVNLNIKQGSVFGLIGPNGAGKTSLIKVLTGIWEADRGTVKIKGQEISGNIALKEVIGYVPDQSHYYDAYKIKEMVKFYQLAYKNFNQERFEKLNSIFGLGLSKRVRELSKGMKGKLSILLNLSIMPELLILDEPTSGLDPIAKKRFFEMILEEVAERKITVLISSHYLGDLEQICDDIAAIHQGQIEFAGAVDEMKKKVRKFQVVFQKGIPEEIKARKDILSINNIGSIYYLITKDYSKSFEKSLMTSGATLIEEINIGLEDIFVHYFEGRGKQNETAQ